MLSAHFATLIEEYAGTSADNARRGILIRIRTWITKYYDTLLPQVDQEGSATFLGPQRLKVNTDHRDMATFILIVYIHYGNSLEY